MTKMRAPRANWGSIGEYDGDWFLRLSRVDGFHARYKLVDDGLAIDGGVRLVMKLGVLVSLAEDLVEK